MSKEFPFGDERAEGSCSSASYNWLHVPGSRLGKE
jgi:hypothetical protein